MAYNKMKAVNDRIEERWGRPDAPSPTSAEDDFLNTIEYYGIKIAQAMLRHGFTMPDLEDDEITEYLGSLRKHVLEE